MPLTLTLPVLTDTWMVVSLSKERMKKLVDFLETALEAVRLEHTLRERAGQNGKVAPLDPEL